MENVVLTIHLILALLLIGVVLLQRSEGGGLGMGSTGGVMSNRGAATALSKLTWVFAIGFIITSISLTLIAARVTGAGSIADQIATPPAASDAPAPGGTSTLPAGGDLLPPTPGDAPAAPPAAPAAPAAPSN